MGKTKPIELPSIYEDIIKEADNGKPEPRWCYCCGKNVGFTIKVGNHLTCPFCGGIIS